MNRTVLTRQIGTSKQARDDGDWGGVAIPAGGFTVFVKVRIDSTAAMTFIYLARPDLHLAVGDEVTVPGSWLNPNPRRGVVVELDADWQGSPAMVRRVLDVVTRAGGKK